MQFPFPTSNAGPARVVITGAGLITPLGRGWDANARGFQAGDKSIGPVTHFDVSGNRAKIAAEVKGDLRIDEPRISKRKAARFERAARMLLIAARECWDQAKWSPNGSLPLILGTTSGGMTLGQTFYEELDQSRRGQASRITHYLPQRQGLDLQEALGFTGPVMVIANACATGANVIGHAWELVRSRQADRVLVGAYDAISQLVFTGFDSLQALSPDPCRPFDAARNGLTLGEGAAVLALESLESAQARNATILGEVAGYGASTDSHHLTQPHPDGLAALAAMRLACKRAGVSAEQIGYVNAHGTATPHNDRSEAAAINAWANGHAQQMNVSSTKAGVGHSLGAAGAIEAVVSIMALRGQWLPPSRGLGEIDPLVQFSIVREATTTRAEYALTNSFGFGGANATLILRRAP